MNRHNLTRTIFGAALLFAFAACTQDELSDGNGTSLPEGKYPLEIGSISLAAEVDEQPWRAGAPQTRVSENPDGNSSAWEWNGTERIGVQLYEDGDVATYTLNSGKTLTPDKTLYWKDTQQTTVTAWYPAYTGESGIVSLADQSSGLAYVLKGSGTGTYDAPVELSFAHQLAKVRVVLNGNEADKAKVKDVKIWSHTNCTHTNGNISGSNEGWITMMKVARGTETVWEANVVPGKTIEKFQVNGTTNGTLTTSVTPEAGKWHEVKIKIEEKVTEIQPGADGNYTVNEGDNVLIKGDGSPYTGQINISGTAQVTLDNIKMQRSVDSGAAAIHITNGTATIILKGTNTITIGDFRDICAIELDGTNANVLIKGTEGGSLNITTNSSQTAIGSRRNRHCGNITIENATINASINSKNGGCAAIGTSSGFDGDTSCGIIKIINSSITASVQGTDFGKAAVIGTGGTDGGNLSCKGIEITLKEGENKDAFLSRLTGDYYTQVGAGEALNGFSNTCSYVRWYNADGTEIK